MTDHVDGFIATVPTANQETCRAFAEQAAAMFKEFGATQVVETWEDDVPEGKVTSFPMAVQRKDGESVIFSRIVWPSKAVREDGWADPRMADQQMPFDGQRMIHGGFQTIVDG